MPIAVDFKPADNQRFTRSYTVFSQSRMLETLGQDLRRLYADLDDHASPHDLVRLAGLIDEQRQVLPRDG